MFALTRLSRAKLPRVPFKKIAEKVLGASYSLSLVIADDKTMRRLNRTYRAKNKITNELSFPLDAKTGELFLHIGTIKKEARMFGAPLRAYLAYLYIHGLLHLKGYRHGSTMERKERLLLRAHGFAKRGARLPWQ